MNSLCCQFIFTFLFVELLGCPKLNFIANQFACFVSFTLYTKHFELFFDVENSSFYLLSLSKSLRKRSAHLWFHSLFGAKQSTSMYDSLWQFIITCRFHIFLLCHKYCISHVDQNLLELGYFLGSIWYRQRSMCDVV